jgi:hypothetical protein
MEPKVLLMHGFDQDEALAIMRAVKAAVKRPEDIAFAMTTETNREWKVEDLIEHVGEEHEFMRKGRVPRDSPPLA